MLLTVIIVTKNPGEDIYPTLSSLKYLDAPSVEILLKDNSSDKKLERINEVFHFKNFQYISSADNGIYDAMNQALDKARGKFIYFLNAGDQYIDCNLLNILENDEGSTGFYYGDVIFIKPNVKLIRYTSFVNKYVIYLRTICHQGVIFRKEVFNKIGLFDTHLPVNADHLFLIQLANRFKGKKIDQFLSIYKGGGVSSEHQLSDSEKSYMNEQIEKTFTTPEIQILRFVSALISVLIFLKQAIKRR